MVLELLASNYKLKNKPYLMFFEAMFLTFLSVLISVSFFSDDFVSIAVLAFITIGAIPLFNKLFSYDSYLFNYNKSFFRRHRKIIILLLNFFVGILFAFVIVYLTLPADMNQNIFSSQLSEMENISDARDSLTGQFSGSIINSESNFFRAFEFIFKHNFVVMISATILSFLYGAGGLFLIAWNASILATHIVVDVLVSISEVNASFLLKPFLAFFHSIINFITYIPHGFFEVVAYFFVSVAGALLARDLFKGVFSTDFKWKALKDILLMFLIAVFSLLIGALIEASYFI